MTVRKFTFYSSLWATVLMFVLFLFSGLTGSLKEGQPRLFPLTNSKPLQGRVVVLDPGHGGPDPGTVGVGPTTEAENVLAIAWELKGLLEKAGAQVVMTRQADLTAGQGLIISGRQDGELAARVAKANRGSGEVFISLHNNWNDNEYISGTSVHYYKPQDLALAEALQTALVGQIASVDLGVRRQNLYVLRNTNIPAALVEVGFLSNAEEALLLSRPAYRLEVARGLFKGVVHFFKG